MKHIKTFTYKLKKLKPNQQPHYRKTDKMKLKIEYDAENNGFRILGNTLGLIYLAKNLLGMSLRENVESGTHLHLYPESNELDTDSLLLTIDNLDFNKDQRPTKLTQELYDKLSFFGYNWGPRECLLTANSKRKSYAEVIPILLEYLPVIDVDSIKKDIIQYLEAVGSKEAIPLLQAELNKAEDKEIKLLITKTIQKIEAKKHTSGKTGLKKTTSLDKSLFFNRVIQLDE